MWPALRVEYALLYAIAHNNQGFLRTVHDELKKWLYRTDLVPPFSTELLRAIEWNIRGNTRFKETVEIAGELKGRVAYFEPYVRTALHLLIRPCGSTSFKLLEILGHDLWTDVVTAARRATTLYGIRVEHFTPSGIESTVGTSDDWKERLVWPFRKSDGSWSSPQMEDVWPAGLINHIDFFWKRWDSILSAVPSLRPLELQIRDQLRRALCWHVLVVSGKLCTPIPIFPALMLDSGSEPQVEWLGPHVNSSDNRPGLAIDEHFCDEVSQAHRWAIDTWVSRNRSWRGVKHTIGDIPIDSIRRSTLILDVRWAASELQQLRIPLKVSDRSVGLTVATGVVSLLAGMPIDATVWSTGQLVRAIPDIHKRLHEDGDLMVNDVEVGWPSGGETLARSLATKFVAARAHSIAQHIIVPEELMSDALTIFHGLEDQLFRPNGLVSEANPIIDQPKLALGIHPVAVPRLSNASDAALPITYRKYRYILCPDINWAFSLSQYRRQAGSHDALSTEQLQRGQTMLAELSKHSVVFVEGPPLSGKSYAIAGALTAARNEATLMWRPAPRVTFIRWPRFKWPEESWRMILQGLSFPDKLIDDFVHAATKERKAEIFITGLRKYGPDILVLGNIEQMLQSEEGIRDPSKFKYSSLNVLASICDLISRHPIKRHDDISKAIGSIELIIERSKPADEHPYFMAVGHVALTAFSWKAEDAWQLVQSVLLEQPLSMIGIPLVSLVQRLSMVHDALTTNGLYIISSSIGLRSDQLSSCIQTLTSLCLYWHKEEFHIAMDSDRSFGCNTGPLLRQSNGKLHIHPLIREIAYRSLIESLTTNQSFELVQQRQQLALLHYNLAVSYFCPFLSPRQFKGLSSIVSMLHWSILQAHYHLTTGIELLGARHNSKGRAPLLEQLSNARMMLLRYYHDPSVGLARELFRELKTAKGPISHRREWLAYTNLSEFLDRYQGLPRPSWLMLRAAIAEKIDPKEPGLVAKRREALALENYLAAIRHLSSLDEPERELWRRRAYAQLVLFTLNHQEDGAFPYGMDLPEQFKPSNIWETWKATSTYDNHHSLRFYLEEPLALRLYSDIGDAALVAGKVKIAKQTYLLAYKRMRQIGKLYPPLIIRAIGIVACLDGERKALNMEFSEHDWRGVCDVLKQTTYQEARYFLSICARLFDGKDGLTPEPEFPRSWEKSRLILTGSLQDTDEAMQLASGKAIELISGSVELDPDGQLIGLNHRGTRLKFINCLSAPYIHGVRFYAETEDGVSYALRHITHSGRWYLRKQGVNPQQLKKKRERHRLFVSNLPPSTTEDVLLALLTSVNCELRKVRVESSDDKREPVVGIVDFHTLDALEDAIGKLYGYVLNRYQLAFSRERPRGSMQSKTDEVLP